MEEVVEVEGHEILACPCRGWVMTGELTRMKLTSGQGWLEARISEWKREGEEPWSLGGALKGGSFDVNPPA